MRKKNVEERKRKRKEKERKVGDGGEKVRISLRLHTQQLRGDTVHGYNTNSHKYSPRWSQTRRKLVPLPA